MKARNGLYKICFSKEEKNITDLSNFDTPDEKFNKNKRFFASFK
jgi:hypothetical protein